MFVKKYEIAKCSVVFSCVQMATNKVAQKYYILRCDKGWCQRDTKQPGKVSSINNDMITINEIADT